MIVQSEHREYDMVSILVVEDRPENLVALGATLSSATCRVVTASSSEQALGHVLEQQFAVVLLVVRAPSKEGFVTARLIRRCEAGRHVPIIFLMETDAGGEMVHQAYSAGAVDCLIEPIDPFVLGAKVNAFADLSRRTQRIKAREAALAIENARLERAAQDAIGAHDEFISIASHELRTPLTPLQIQLQRLISERQREPLEKLPVERVRSMLVRSERQVQRIATIVDNLLEVSRIGAGRLNLQCERMDLSEVVKEVASRFAEDVRRSGSVLSVKADATVFGSWDPWRVEQVFTNLFANAIKYGAGNPIDIVVEGDASRARVTVRDRGIGISATEQGRIFGRFERAGAPRSHGGLGLGLYIARQVLDAHGGAISVESTPGVGSKFVVELPRRARAIELDRSDETDKPARDPIDQAASPGLDA